MNLSAIAVGFALLATADRAAQSPSPWSALAKHDLDAIHGALLENHPGPVDPQNPGFHLWLEDGYRQALDKAGQARTFQGYTAALRRYVNGFHDGHLGVYFWAHWDDLHWPGFLVSLRSSKYVVSQSDPGDAALPPNGSEIVDCDGKSPAELLDRDVFPYWGNPALEASRFQVTPRLLVDEGYPDVPTLKQCRIKVNEVIKPFTLEARQIDADDLWTKQQAAAFGERPKFAFHPFGKNGMWVTLPSFGTDGKTAELLQAAIAQASTWRSRDPIVFDVRGNSGGSSLWGDHLIEGLWGTPFSTWQRSRASPKDQYVEWRPSTGNLKVIEHYIAELGPRLGPEAVKSLERIAASMRAAIASKTPLMRVPNANEEPVADAGSESSPSNPLQGRVFLLTDGRCGSACLDFADRLLPFPNVTHVGLPTTADSVYMEARRVDLPSGVAFLNLPMKVYRNRPRGSNVPYIPKFRYDGEMADSAALEKWVLGLAAKLDSLR